MPEVKPKIKAGSASELIDVIARLAKDGECEHCLKNGYEGNLECEEHFAFELSSGEEAAALLHDLIERARTVIAGEQPQPGEPTRDALIYAARNAYQNDDIEVDDDARLSRLDEGGAWVAAWVYVHYDDCMCSLDEDVRRIRRATGSARLSVLLVALVVLIALGNLAFLFVPDPIDHDLNHPVRVIQAVEGRGIVYYTACETSQECEDEWRRQIRKRGEVQDIREHNGHFDATLKLRNREHKLSGFLSIDDLELWAYENGYYFPEPGGEGQRY